MPAKNQPVGPMKVLFFPNGNTAAFQDGKQVPVLQESWLLLYIHMIAAIGIDVTEIEFIMPDTSRVKVESEDGRFIIHSVPSFPAAVCQGCYLPEDGLKVRNVSTRPSGALMCAECAAESDHGPEPAADLDAVEQWMHGHKGGDVSHELPESDAPF